MRAGSPASQAGFSIVEFSVMSVLMGMMMVGTVSWMTSMQRSSNKVQAEASELNFQTFLSETINPAVCSDTFAGKKIGESVARIKASSKYCYSESGVPSPNTHGCTANFDRDIPGCDPLQDPLKACSSDTDCGTGNHCKSRSSVFWDINSGGGVYGRNFKVMKVRTAASSSSGGSAFALGRANLEVFFSRPGTGFEKRDEGKPCRRDSAPGGSGSADQEGCYKLTCPMQLTGSPARGREGSDEVGSCRMLKCGGGTLKITAVAPPIAVLCGGAGTAGSFHSNGGGFVQSTAAVADTAHVAKTAVVCGTAKVEGRAKIMGNAQVLDQATVKDNALVYDSAKVSGSAAVQNNAKVYGNAKVSGGAVRDNALVYDSAGVSGGTVRDNVKVYDNAKISGSAVIRDNAEVYGMAEVSGGIIKDSAQVYDMARVSGTAGVYDKAKVYGAARVRDSAQIYGDGGGNEGAQVYGNSLIANSARVYGRARIYGNGEVFGGAWVYGNAKITADAQVGGPAPRISGTAHITGGAWVRDYAQVSAGLINNRAGIQGHAKIRGNAGGAPVVNERSWIHGRAVLEGNIGFTGTMCHSCVCRHTGSNNVIAEGHCCAPPGRPPQNTCPDLVDNPWN